MNFSDPEVQARYKSLGFVPDNWGMKVKIGYVQIHAMEHPLRGVALWITCFAPRTATQFDITLPANCSREVIAGMIHANIARVIPEETEASKLYFKAAEVPLFQ